MKKQKKIQNLKLLEDENNKFTNELTHELNENPEFSLEVDPTNKYSMSDAQKTFVKNYCEFKSIPIAADLTGIDLGVAKSYFMSYASQQEIRRINRAMYQKQFSSKLLSIDEISSYLSSLITDENVPIGDRVKTMDKVKIAGMLIDLQIYKHDAINNPQNIIDVNIEDEIKNLSISSIKNLLAQKNNESKDKTSLDGLFPEEEAYLKTLPAKELLQIINNTTGEKKDDNK